MVDNFSSDRQQSFIIMRKQGKYLTKKCVIGEASLLKLKVDTVSIINDNLHVRKLKLSESV